jgi:hypothetical protein
MPLMPAAIPAIPDNAFKTVSFVMKDGTKTVVVLVSNAALEDIEPVTSIGAHFRRFKRYRRRFEQMASDKYDRGHVELDGTVCIKAADLPLVSAN